MNEGVWRAGGKILTWESLHTWRKISPSDMKKKNDPSMHTVH